jgi:exodeoxyribonuclease V beta subunit
MIELNHLQVDLSGPHLIEASAGTGKTYAIALLYLRILVELKLEPKQILVVTFTEAATKELRGRIRQRIREALDVFDGISSEDPLLHQLCDNANGLWSDTAAIRDILDRALKSFDTAAIFTIHGFCLRALQENAFESGSRYDTELVTDQTGLLREVVDDFWRRSFFSDTAHLLAFALKKKYSVDSLRAFAQGMTGNPKLKIIPECSSEQIAGLDGDCLSLFGAIHKMWTDYKLEIVDLLSRDEGLSRSADYYKVTLLPDLFSKMDRFVAGANPYDLPAEFSKFTASGIIQGKKPKGTELRHPFFELCDELQQKALKRLRLFCGELIAYGNEQLPVRKQQYNIRFFSDLLNDLYGALCSDSGAAFAAKLRTSYQAALIDEFQDTDPVQYDIFKKIYADTPLPLFLIGDPKQAIYSFRGADIFAYIQASMDVKAGSRFTLTSNWRSTPDLLAAFNRIFAEERKPFIYDQIDYHPVASGREAGKKLTLTDGAAAPMQIRLLPADDLTVTRANELLPKAVAAEISRLLREGAADRAMIGAEPVLPADIAVIVRSHRQASSIRDALSPLGIPCVVRSDMTIFATDEAREVCTLLQGLLNPGSEPRVRAALVTDILGRSGSDIAVLLDDEQAWDQCLERFRDYHQAWHDRGFMVMTRLLMEREGVRGRLLRYPDGERRLTNLLHCFEVIHGKAHERGIGMEGLVTWFSERVSAKEKKEEHEIRLETDEKAVKILTVHVSKGLEYPIVFCPYMWTGIIGSDEVATFHEGTAMVKDYGSDEFDLHKDWAEKEQLAESLRLLYVAVTRAKYRCYLYGGKVKSSSVTSRPQTSPIAYLFHASPETRSAENLVSALASEFLGLSAETIQEQMQQLAAGSDGVIWADTLPESLTPIPCLPQQDA